MKILHLDFDDLESPTSGGQAVRTFEINRRLAKKGHQITVVTLNYPGATNKIKEGVYYERYGKKHYPFNFISYLFGIRSIVQKHTFDLIVEDNIPPISFGLSPLYTHKPVIAQIQSLFAEQSSQKHHLPFRFFEQQHAKHYKNFIVLTEHLKEKIHSLNTKAAIIIIPNGLSQIYPLINTHAKQLLYLGRINYHHKGIDRLIRIAKILQKTLPDYKIIIAGDGQDRKKMEDTIHNNQLKNIEYKGRIEGSEKETLIKNSALLLLPSNFETLPFTILEAAGHGKATIFFDIPNLNELAKKQIGIAVPAYDESLFAHTVVQTTQDKKLLATLGKNAHNWAKTHLWDTIVEEQEKFYQSCLPQ